MWRKGGAIFKGSVQMISVKIVLDSIAENGVRLITLEATYPRFIHDEVMTHRMFSRNAASSRAIPVKKKIDRMWPDIAEPVEWGKNQPGMSADELVDAKSIDSAKGIWRQGARDAIQLAQYMDKLSVHKQIVNRMLEPYDHITTILTSTSWANFRFLRDHKDADPTFQALARAVGTAIDASTPTLIGNGGWHTPYIQGDEYISLDIDTRKKVSAGRCARVSYLTHDGKRDIAKDIELFDRLVSREDPSTQPGHWSPLEHVATPIPFWSKLIDKSDWLCEYCHFNKQSVIFETSIICDCCARGHIYSGNFLGWKQFRKEFEYEYKAD